MEGDHGGHGPTEKGTEEMKGEKAPEMFNFYTWCSAKDVLRNTVGR